MAVIRLLTKGQRGKTGFAGSTNGIDLQHTDANTMVNNNNDFEKSMFNLGFHKYYKDGKIWKHKYLEGTTIVDKDTTEVAGVGFLQPGDMLVCKSNDGGHVEFYNGFVYDVTYYNMISDSISERKKSGIASINPDKRIQLKPGERKKVNSGNVNSADIEIENTGISNRAYSTFSWGRVRNAYPTDNSGHRNYYFYFENDVFKLCYSCKDNKHNDCDARDYTVIWRKN